MKTKDFYFELPEELIAQVPAKERGESRMLVLDKESGRVEHRMISDFTEYVDDNTLIVFNNSRVRKARVYGTSGTGGKVEFLFLKQETPDSWLVMVSKAKKQRLGKEFDFPGGVHGIITELRDSSYRIIRFDNPLGEEYFDTHGHIPLPPYIKREDAPEDQKRYQTVYSERTGSVAAPTAGLHFTPEILEKLKDKGVPTAFVTLHVGLGTFLPIRSESIEDHDMHTEEYEISQETAEMINQAKAEGKKIMAVGTTSVRTLESAANEEGIIMPGKRATKLFIKPGYKFKAVDKILTNFHTPESTLLILVSTFAGMENIRSAYNKAVEERYRFFSYGDAMLIL